MFEIIKLPNDVTRGTASNARYGAKARQIRAMAYSTLNGLAGTARDERLPFRNAADRHVRGKLGMAIVSLELVEIVGYFDNTSANRLRTAIF